MQYTYYTDGNRIIVLSHDYEKFLVGQIIGEHMDWGSAYYIAIISNPVTYKNIIGLVPFSEVFNMNDCCEMEVLFMPKLTGYKQVAEIKQMGKPYYYAIYDDGRKYYPGDHVLVSGVAGGTIQTIESIIDPEEAVVKMNGKNITAEIISYVDTSSYEERVKNRKTAEKLKKDMDNVIKQMEENNKYEMYAEKNPELKEMLDTYKKLIG